MFPVGKDCLKKHYMSRILSAILLNFGVNPKQDDYALWNIACLFGGTVGSGGIIAYGFKSKNLVDFSISVSKYGQARILWAAKA